MIWEYFFPVYSLSFHTFNKIFFRAKSLILIESNLSIFPFMYCDCGVKDVIHFVFLNVKNEKENIKRG